jgi:hypothetical protein|tara:strand:- start:24 stop:260 length:237 start_codon:yes stop_codon:yes gene_type:complete
MRKIWRLDNSILDKENQTYKRMYDVFYTSKKKAIKEAEDIIKYLDFDIPKVKDRDGFVTVTPTNSLNRYIFITSKELN